MDLPRLLEVKSGQTHRSISESDPDELSWPLTPVFGEPEGGAQVFANSIAVVLLTKSRQKCVSDCLSRT